MITETQRTQPSHDRGCPFNRNFGIFDSGSGGRPINKVIMEDLRRDTIYTVHNRKLMGEKFIFGSSFPKHFNMKMCLGNSSIHKFGVVIGILSCNLPPKRSLLGRGIFGNYNQFYIGNYWGGWLLSTDFTAFFRLLSRDPLLKNKVRFPTFDQDILVLSREDYPIFKRAMEASLRTQNQSP
ncbi:hypothetical protein G9A89_013450 [Geosiphon pyriformis]|nr:hypothetical protein G9A89_013450 [Geosiphon pyriformis]